MSNNGDSPEKSALSTAGDFIKYSTAFAAGTLAFSVGLVKETVSFTTWSKGCLIASWILLVVSVVSGVLVFSRIPVQLKQQNYDLEDKYFTIPGRIHQLSFIAGIVMLGI